MVFIMQIAIICGGLATRLGSLAETIPKSMLDIHGKPFLQHQIEMLKKQNITDIVLCVGHLSEQIESYFGNGEEFGVNISYSYDGGKKLGPIGAIKNAESLLEKDFFIMYGDSYVFVDFQEIYDFYKKHDKQACMVVYKNENRYDRSNLLVENKMVVGHKDLNKNEEVKYIDYGTSLLSEKSLENIPKNMFFSTEDFFKRLILKKELLAYEVKKRFYHIGNPESLEEFREYAKNDS